MNAKNTIVLPPSEWADAKGIRAQFGLNRGFLYQLMAAGKIVTRSVRVPGNIKGRRLFSVPSVRALIENSESNPNG